MEELQRIRQKYPHLRCFIFFEMFASSGGNYVQITWRDLFGKLEIKAGGQGLDAAVAASVKELSDRDEEIRALVESQSS